MREIKFRAWDKEKKKMYFPYVGLIEGELIEVESAYMQYTGLKDKNGKEIYEGDIIKHTKKYYQITWNEYQCKFCLLDTKYKDFENFADSDDEDASDMYDECLGNFSDKYCEVIGNLYQNPELLRNE